MSDVARYTAAGDGVVRLDDQGPLVVWQDYARLQAEVERLTNKLDQAECDHDNCQKRKVSIDNHRFGLFEENKKLKAEVERLGEENKTRQKDMELLFASYKQALEDIRRLHWDLQTAKEGKPSV